MDVLGKNFGFKSYAYAPQPYPSWIKDTLDFGMNKICFTVSICPVFYRTGIYVAVLQLSPTSNKYYQASLSCQFLSQISWIVGDEILTRLVSQIIQDWELRTKREPLHTNIFSGLLIDHQELNILFSRLIFCSPFYLFPTMSDFFADVSLPDVELVMSPPLEASSFTLISSTVEGSFSFIVAAIISKAIECTSARLLIAEATFSCSFCKRIFLVSGQHTLLVLSLL